MPISTAWAWWVDMSRANPASAESSAGLAVVADAGVTGWASGDTARPTAYPKIKAITTASEMLPGISHLRACMSSLSQVVRCGAGDGDAAGARGALLLRGVLAQCSHEGVDAGVAGVVDLELVAPGLEADRRAEVVDRAHECVFEALDALGELGDLSLQQ